MICRQSRFTTRASMGLWKLEAINPKSQLLASSLSPRRIQRQFLLSTMNASNEAHMMPIRSDEDHAPSSPAPPLSARSTGDQSASAASIRTNATASSKARRALSGLKSRFASSNSRHRHTESAPPESFERLAAEDEREQEGIPHADSATQTTVVQREGSVRRRKASLRSIKSLARKTSSVGNGNRSSAHSHQEDDAPPLPGKSLDAAAYDLNTGNAQAMEKVSNNVQRAPSAATRLHSYSHHASPPDSGSSKWKDPLASQRGLILRAVLVTAIAAQVSAWLLHWSVGIIAAAVGAHISLKLFERAGKDMAWEREAEERRKSAKQAHHPETAEWVNHLLATVWPLISAEYLVPFIDLLEDALMQQVPGIVHGCRVEGLDQGTIPLRIVDFKRLPDDDESFSQPETTSKSARKQEILEEDRTQQHDAPALDVGDFVNLEVSFAYRGPQARRRKAQSNKVEGLDTPTDAHRGVNDGNEEDDSTGIEQIHLLLYMAIGLQKIAAVQVPVWIEMLGIEGKMRVRLQMTPAAPFVKHVAFCFVDKPRIEISAKPLSKRMVIDAMNLPLISSYVLHSIERVIKDFIAPQSYTVDVGSLLGAGDGPQNVYALGVMVVVLHRANGLAAADVGGTSDPYVGISFARAGKALYLSRVMARTKDPVWGETSFLLVGPDEVRDHERLRLAVYDADRFSADDELGHVDVSISRLIRRSLNRPGKPGHVSFLEHRQDDLAPARRGASVQGSLNYSVGFFRLAQPASGHPATRTHLLQQAANKCYE
ncbi:Ca2-dependent lipid-binding protein CLB1/vesicle protein vp115/Granuphilin A, contains C2 domain [Ceraceosorus bombacis]|uniref:Ca2-dependent lipid-binding protein CLB1/vesicle protein vp115/Granuphilin A, contains C2 domain n=1 Tax=Ceraceosorus bombacis TaxID=401625 RepID=A0A0P1BJV3_9BASI|nr:Ca2-dependent lipid-binding protein CLB1/vesicle protein vp115/Granuphilin A, contains C2 domain [Ceraceosorus bombacis]